MPSSSKLYERDWRVLRPGDLREALHVLHDSALQRDWLVQIKHYEGVAISHMYIEDAPEYYYEYNEAWQQLSGSTQDIHKDGKHHARVCLDGHRHLPLYWTKELAENDYTGRNKLLSVWSITSSRFVFYRAKEVEHTPPPPPSEREHRTIRLRKK